jgi:tetratricopeptide (TPR) repeat protein
MPEGLWESLKRRRVIRVAAAYVAVALATLEGAELVMPRLGLPDRVLTVLVAVAALGFPLVVGLAWVYDLTPGGLIRTAPGSDDSAASRPGFRHPWRVLALVGATVLFGAIALSWLPRVPAFRAIDVDEAALVVLPFEVRGGDEVDYLGEGMVDLLTTKLDGVGGLRLVDPLATFAVLRGAAGGPWSGEEARQLSARLGAGRAILGSVVLVGPSLQVRAAAYGPGDGESVEASVAGSPGELFRLVDELARMLVTRGLVRDETRLASLEGLTTSSSEALRLYLEAVRGFRTGTGGADNFGLLARAVELDSTFTLAAYWAGHVAEYYERADPLPFFQLASRHQDRLGRRDRLRLAAALAGAEGRHSDAIRTYTALVDRHPDDVDGWLQLGEQLAHKGHFTGRTLAEARPAYERAITLDPALAPAYYHLSHIASLQGDTAAMRAWASLMDSVGVDSLFIADMELVLSLVSGDTVGRRPSFERFLVGESNEVPPATISGSLAELLGATLEHAPDASRALIHEWGDRVLTDTARTVAGRRAARIEAGSGRFRRAEAALNAIGASLGTVLAQDLAWVALHPAAYDPERALAAFEALVSLAPPDGSGEAATRHYLLGRLALELGRDDAFLAARDSLRGFEPPDERVARFAGDLARELEAVSARRDGDPARALEILLGASYWDRSQSWLGFPDPTYLDTRLPDRAPMFLRAELLREAGNDSEAARWYRVAADGIWFKAPALLELAALHTRQGNGGAAAELRRRARRLWADADPGPRDMLERLDQAVVSGPDAPR